LRGDGILFSLYAAARTVFGTPAFNIIENIAVLSFGSPAAFHAFISFSVVTFCDACLTADPAAVFAQLAMLDAIPFKSASVRLWFSVTAALSLLLLGILPGAAAVIAPCTPAAMLENTLDVFDAPSIAACASFSLSVTTLSIAFL